MQINTIQTTDAPNPVGPYSQAKIVGSFVFLSGQIALDPKSSKLIEGGIREQSHQVCKNIGAVLKAAGIGYEQVVKSTCFLKDMGDFPVFNEVYAEYFGKSKPARSTVQAAKLPMDVLVEIECIAVI